MRYRRKECAFSRRCANNNVRCRVTAAYMRAIYVPVPFARCAARGFFYHAALPLCHERVLRACHAAQQHDMPLPQASRCERDARLRFRDAPRDTREAPAMPSSQCSRRENMRLFTLPSHYRYASLLPVALLISTPLLPLAFLPPSRVYALMLIEPRDAPREARRCFRDFESGALCSAAAAMALLPPLRSAVRRFVIAGAPRRCWPRAAPRGILIALRAERDACRACRQHATPQAEARTARPLRTPAHYRAAF